MCLEERGEMGEGKLCAWVWELAGPRRYSHAGGGGRKRKREAGGLSGGPEEREELLGRCRMRMGWEMCMRGLGAREDGGRLSAVAPSAVRGVGAILE